MVKRFLISCLVFCGMFISFDLQARVREDSKEGDIIAFANDTHHASNAVEMAEGIRERFIHYFGIKLSKHGVPVVLVLENTPGESGSIDKNLDEGVVRVFKNATGLQLQINWNELPIPLDSCQYGYVRAVCTRLAMEAAAQENSSGKASSLKSNVEWRIPMWITDGIAALSMEPENSQEIWARATLLAKTEPNLSLQEALTELGGQTSLTSVQRALAAVLCRAFTQTPQMRARFLSHLNWNPTTTARDWLAMVLGKKELDPWWLETWKKQTHPLTWLKLGYQPTLRWIFECEAISQFSSEPSQAPPNTGAFYSDLSTFAHPWFRPWIIGRSLGPEHEPSTKAMITLRKNIQFRRNLALQWFSQQELIYRQDTRKDLLLWSRNERNLNKKFEVEGPIESWFRLLTQ